MRFLTVYIYTFCRLRLTKINLANKDMTYLFFIGVMIKVYSCDINTRNVFNENMIYSNARSGWRRFILTHEPAGGIFI